MRRLPIVEAVEAHYLVLVLDALLEAGVLARLGEAPATSAGLAGALGLDAAMLEPLLAFAALRSEIVVAERDGGYRVPPGRAPSFAAHMLDQYVGGYGPLMAALARLLRDPAAGAGLFDRQRHARAFGGVEEGPPSEPARLVLELGATQIVDLGCGGGQMLCEAAAANREMRGLGIDASPAAADAARQQVRSRGLEGRIGIECGDALAVLEALPEQERASIQLVAAASLLNAFWGRDGAAAAFLRTLGDLLPGRIVIVSDYYSHLARGDLAEAEPRTLIHDLAQLASGQGLPPADADGWAVAYREAGAELLQTVEAAGDGIDRFLHIVRLAG